MGSNPIHLTIFYAHVVPSRFERVDVVIGTETVGSNPTVCTISDFEYK